MQFSHTLTGPKRRGGKDLRLFKKEREKKKESTTQKIHQSIKRKTRLAAWKGHKK